MHALPFTNLRDSGTAKRHAFLRSLWARRGELASFLFLVCFSMWVCITTFVLLAGKSHPASSIWKNFWQSLPLCFLAALADYAILGCKVKSTAVRPLVRLVLRWGLCSLGAGMLVSAASFLFVWGKRIEMQNVLTFLLWNSLIVGGIEIWLRYLHGKESEAARLRAEREKIKWQYEALKSQVNPHFLFNSLNSLAALAWQDASRTNLFAKQLAGVYRYLLVTAGQSVVSLREELDFLDSYFYLERIRMGETLQVSVSTEEGTLLQGILPASIQMLVENALKHNICTAQHPLHITISARQGRVVVGNNVQPRPFVARSGLGLGNLRQRYALWGRTIAVSRSPGRFSVELPLLPSASPGKS